VTIRRRDLLAGALGASALPAVTGDDVRAAPEARQGSQGQIFAAALTCESFRNPLGIDSPRPRLGWLLQPTEPEARGLRQRAYQVQVATTPALLDTRPDLWDSGFVESGEQLAIEYAGAPLTSRLICHWRVRVWDAGGRPSGWSRPARWEVGLLEASDWRGTWIDTGAADPATRADFYLDDPAPLLRREFDVAGPVARARLYAAGLGYYELRLNGGKVSDHVLDPAWTSFGKRVPYTSHDVTALLQPGSNALGAMLGNGWFNPLPLQMWGRINIREHLITGQPRLVAQLEIDYEDGTRETIATDEDWSHHPGPIMRNSVYLGEAYDARQEQPGWDMPGFDAGSWKSAVPVETGADDTPLGPLEAQSVAPIRVTDRLRPVSVKEVSRGVFIFDMGQNFAGWVRLQVEGPRGSRVRMRFGELLYPDGTLNPMTAVAGQIKRPNEDGSSRGGPGAPIVAEQVDSYTLSGEGIETYTPRFTFHGFRYVEVTGFPGRPELDALEGQRLNTDVDNIGTFTSSDDTLNRIQKMVQWTLLSNLFSVQSDCPAREKFQYGGDIVATSEMATLNYDFAALYAKTVRDHADAVQGDAERGEGWITETAPFVGISADNYVKDAGPIGWGLAHPLLVVQLHQYYGDRRIVAEQYDVARRWVELYADHADGHIIDRCLSDHESIDPKPVALTATAHYLQAARLVARMAEILGRADDQARFEQLADGIQAAFVERFLDPGTGVFDTGTQACQRAHGGAGRGRARRSRRHRDLRHQVPARGTHPGRPRRRRLRDGHQERVPRLGPHARARRHHALGALGVQRRHVLAQPSDVRLGERMVLQGRRWRAAAPRGGGFRSLLRGAQHDRRRELGAGAVPQRSRPHRQQLVPGGRRAAHDRPGAGQHARPDSRPDDRRRRRDRRQRSRRRGPRRPRAERVARLCPFPGGLGHLPLRCSVPPGVACRAAANRRVARRNRAPSALAWRRSAPRSSIGRAFPMPPRGSRDEVSPLDRPSRRRRHADDGRRARSRSLRCPTGRCR
jgi:alpha-L-rhamnosidase